MKLHRQPLLARLRRRPPWRDDAVTFKRHQRWGDAATFLNYDHGSVYGFGRFPRVGDVLTSEMESGHVGVFLFVEVERCGNPPDMWTGTVEGLGYESALRHPLPAAPEPSDFV